MGFTFIDLFAGIGGFHAALKPLGGECVFASEWDEMAANTYSKNWLKNRNFKIHGDIRELTEGRVIRVPKHDVLTGGFPCQPFSKSGNQLGVNETRGTLFYNILRIIEARQPKIVLLENVRNLVGPKHHSDYLTMVRLLRELGYAISQEPTILSPHEIPKELGGSPQHRQRVFIGGIRVGQKRALKLSDLDPLIPRNSFGKTPSNSWDIKRELINLKRNSGDSVDHLKISDEQSRALIMWDHFLKRFRFENASNPPGLPLWTDYWRPRREIRISRETPDWKVQFILRNQEIYKANKVWIDQWKKKFNLLNHIPSNRKFEWQAKNAKSVFDCLIQFRPSGIRVKESTYVPAFVAITQTPILGWELRELSEVEASRIQGFPENFSFFDQRRSISLKQIGNAVHPGSAALVYQALVQRANEFGLPWAQQLISKSLKIDIRDHYAWNLNKD